MADRGQRRGGLAEHDAALQGLLTSLLGGLPTEAPGGAVRPPEANTAAVTEASLNEPDARPLNQHAVARPVDRQVAPAWTTQRFRALQFRCGEFRFAMPLILMRGVCEFPRRLHRVPGRPHWQLGLFRYRGQSLVVADLGPLLAIGAPCADPRYLLVIGDGQAAVVCDALDEAVVVEPEAVRWRIGAARHRWLLGLLVGPMCSLLDADVLNELIRHG